MRQPPAQEKQPAPDSYGQGGYGQPDPYAGSQGGYQPDYSQQGYNQGGEYGQAGYEQQGAPTSFSNQMWVKKYLRKREMAGECKVRFWRSFQSQNACTLYSRFETFSPTSQIGY